MKLLINSEMILLSPNATRSERVSFERTADNLSLERGKNCVTGPQEKLYRMLSQLTLMHELEVK